MSRKKEILWSPHGDSTFLVQAADLRLWEWKQSSSGEDDSILSSVAHVTDGLALMKCTTWSSDPAHPHLVAVGLNNGRVQLLDLLARDGNDVRYEFAPRQARSCNTVSFNPVFHNQLLAGMDKGRNDPCLLIWDANVHTHNLPTSRSGRAFSNSAFHAGPPRAQPPPVAQEPLRAMLAGDPVTSATWIPSSPWLAAVAAGGRQIRLLDTRSDAAALGVSATKAINGLQADPMGETRILSYSEDGIIKVWDIRKLSAASGSVRK